MAIEAVPYVKTLGQVEVFFTVLISIYWLRDRIRINDISGLVLIAIAAILVMWDEI